MKKKKSKNEKIQANFQCLKPIPFLLKTYQKLTKNLPNRDISIHNTINNISMQR